MREMREGNVRKAENLKTVQSKQAHDFACKQ